MPGTARIDPRFFGFRFGCFFVTTTGSTKRSARARAVSVSYFSKVSARLRRVSVNSFKVVEITSLPGLRSRRSISSMKVSASPESRDCTRLIMLINRSLSRCKASNARFSANGLENRSSFCGIEVISRSTSLAE